jgi:hypothetical protein
MLIQKGFQSRALRRIFGRKRDVITGDVEKIS